MVMAMVSSPPAVTAMHQDAALRHAADCTPLTIKDLLSRSNEELATLYSSLGIPMPESVPTREQLFYAVCSKLFDMNGLDNRHGSSTQRVKFMYAHSVHASCIINSSMQQSAYAASQHAQLTLVTLLPSLQDSCSTTSGNPERKRRCAHERVRP
jgi:hypothetical protein